MMNFETQNTLLALIWLLLNEYTIYHLICLLYF